jgi:hypothetical protein
VGEIRQAHARLLEIAARLEPGLLPGTEGGSTGAEVRRQVELSLASLDADIAAGRVPAWLCEPVRHIGIVLRRLGDGLYQCYDVPALPRTDNALEQFYRRIKTEQRRITGRKRSDAFIVRVGGFAVYATAASGTAESALCLQLATVPAVAWQQQRRHLHQTQLRQTKMRSFHLHRATYLADLETRWSAISLPP